MNKSFNLHGVIIIWMLALGIGAVAEVSAATPEIGGMEWTLDASCKIQVKKVGSETYEGQATLAVGANDDYGLGDGQWKWIDPDEDVLEGTYHEKPDRAGKGIFHFEPSNIDEYLLARLAPFAESHGVVVTELSAGSGAMYPKVTSNKKGTTFSLSATVVADVSVMVGETETPWVVTFKLKVKGTSAAAAQAQGGEENEGSRWWIPTQNTCSITGFKKIVEDGDADVMLGPNPDYDLQANEFIGFEEGIEVVRGTYSQTKNKVTLYGLEDLFTEIVRQYVEQGFAENDSDAYYSDLEITITQLRATATITNQSIIY